MRQGRTGARPRHAVSHLVALALPALLALLPILWRPPVAAAHPLGNFTVNRYSRLELSPEQLRIRYVVDMAEIPTFQAMSSLDADHDGRVADAEKSAYAARLSTQITRNVRLTLNDAEMPLRVVSQEIELLPGQAGLQTLRLSAWLEAPAASATLARAGSAVVRLDYRDENEPDRIGWREIIIRLADGMFAQTIPILPGSSATLPTRDVTDELRSYPEDMLASPPDVRRLHVEVAPGAASARSSTTGADVVAPERTARPASRPGSSDGFAELLSTTTLTPPIILAALLTAIMLGGMHAMSPGHGKTIVGAYLVGSRGTAQHALFLGLVVTITHTAGVFALGLGTLYASQRVVPERVYPWMSLISGLLVLAMGVSLVNTRLRSFRGARAYGQDAGTERHNHDGHADAHAHSRQAYNDRAHTHELLGDVQHATIMNAGQAHAVEAAPAGHSASPLASEPHSHGLGSHTHAIPGADGAPVTWRSLLALGISGGLLPCPSALVVMLGAIALHRVAFGLVLIVAFSAGLAATLMAIGLLMVYSGRIVGRLQLADRFGLGASSRLAFLVRVLPIMSAAVVALAGLALSLEAVRYLDVTPVLSWYQMVAPLALALLIAGVAAALALRQNKHQEPQRADAAGAALALEPVHGHVHDGHDDHDGHQHAYPHTHARAHEHAQRSTPDREVELARQP